MYSMKKLLLLSVALLPLFACNKTESTVAFQEGTTPVRFTVQNINTFDVKSVDPIADGGKVGVFAGTPINRVNSEATVSIDGLNRSLVLTNTMYWGINQTASTEFIAMYPRDENPNFNLTDGTTIEGFNLNSADNFSHPENFLRAAATVEPYETVNLSFTHPFAKVVFEVTNEIPDDVVSGIAVSGFSLTADLNLKTNAVSNIAEPVAVTPYLVSSANNVNTYAAVVIPNSVKPVVTVSMFSGASYLFTLESAFNFEKGKIATAKITLTDTGHGGSETERTPVAIGFSVTDWDNVNAGDMSSSGGGTTPKWWYVGGTIDGKNWVSYQPMKAIGAYLWEATVEYTPAVADPAEAEGVKLRYYDGTPDSQDWDLNFGTTQTPSYNDGVAVITLQRGGMNNNVKLGEAGSYKLTFYAPDADEDKRLTITKL